jgi:pimeloyl-ACP methyl ester carboxylesterase
LEIDVAISDVELTGIEVGEGDEQRTIAVRRRNGRGPALIWLGGFKSDMKGTKAEALDRWAAEQGRACIRFDYSGHGESSGSFADGTIGRWLEESRAVFSQFCEGPTIAIGSSMGGWISLLLARDLREGRAGGKGWSNGSSKGSLAGLVLIAPAVDFTEVLMWQRMTPDIRKQIETTGSWQRPSEYSDEPYLITRQLIEDGRNHLLLGGLIETGCPVRILQGVKDEDVPWEHAVSLVSRIARDDVVLTLVKDGDHRLSRPEDIDRLLAAVAEFG